MGSDESYDAEYDNKEMVGVERLHEETVVENREGRKW